MANRRYGNAGSVSSLISSARSAYEREQAYQDQIAAYEWDLSAKTAEDHDKYVGYLTKRNKELETRDPAKALTFASKINSTRSSFASKEIQRASIAVNYGQGTDSDKYNKMMGLYQNAVNNGDYDLAQNLEAQLGTLQIKIMNAQAAAANAGAANASKAYAATKKGLEAEKNVLNDTLKNLERAVKGGEIDRTEYLTKKKQLLTAKEETIKSFLGVQPDGTLKNPYNLNEDDIRKYSNEVETMRDSNPNFYGKKGDLLDRGLSPFDLKRDPNSNEVQLQDRQVGGYSWMGGTENTPGTIAAPDYVDPVDGKKMSDEFKKLGFEGGKWTKDGYEIKLPNQQIVYAQIKDVNGRKIAIYKDPRNGGLNQVTPEGKTSMLISSSRAGGTDYYSTLMDDQKKAVQAESDKGLFGLAGVGREIYDAVGMTGRAMVKEAGKAFAPKKGGVGGAIQQVADKSMEILGLRKRAEDKAAAERAQWAEQQKAIQATQAAANAARAEQAARAAAQAGSSTPNVGALRYDFTTGKVINGGYGAPAIPGAVQKASKTPGTQEFAKRYVLPKGW